MIDMHCHAGVGHDLSSREPKHACIISRHPDENYRCFAFTRMHGLTCALFADPQHTSWVDVCQWVARGEAIGYYHPEKMVFSDRHSLKPLLRASRIAGTPLVIHVSKHDCERWSAFDAARWLDYFCEVAGNVPIIVSHAGGENFREVLARVLAVPNLLLDLSCWEESAERAGFPAGADLLHVIAENVSPEQLLFGSDERWPTGDKAAQKLLGVLSPILRSHDIPTLLDANAMRVMVAVVSPCAE